MKLNGIRYNVLLGQLQDAEKYGLAQLVAAAILDAYAFVLDGSIKGLETWFIETMRDGAQYRGISDVVKCKVATDLRDYERNGKKQEQRLFDLAAPLVDELLDTQE